MSNEQDCTGVFRRQLFQTMLVDVRLSAVKPDVRKKLRCSEAASPWQLLLRSVCADAAVEHCLDSLTAAAEELGVGLESEVVQFASDLAKSAGLKRLEEARFLKAVSGMPVLPLCSEGSQGSKASQNDQQDDPFGFVGLGFDSGF